MPATGRIAPQTRQRRTSAGAAATLMPEILRSVIGRHPGMARGWFSRLRLGGLDGGVLGIITENLAQAKYLAESCAALFVEAAQAVTGRLLTVEFSADDESRPAEVRRPVVGATLTFESFVVAPCNSLAHAAALAASRRDGAQFNPLFLHGGPGTGKSHLLQAVAHSLIASATGTVAVFRAGEWVSEIVSAVEHDRLEAFRHMLRSADGLLIDEVQDLSECELGQTELFHAVNTLLSAERPVVLAADRPPAELSLMQPRLTSRFAAGLVAGLDLPDFETRAAILRAQAARLAIDVPHEVVMLLSDQRAWSVSDLISALVRLDAQARIALCPLTLAFVRTAMDAPSVDSDRSGAQVRGSACDSDGIGSQVRGAV